MKNQINVSVESTEDVELAEAQWCLIYEKPTGKVIHIHQFLPLTANDRMPPEELEKAAMTALEPERRGQTDILGVFHAQSGDRLEPGMIYSVDPDSLKLSGKRIDILKRIEETREPGKKR